MISHLLIRHPLSRLLRQIRHDILIEALQIRNEPQMAHLYLCHILYWGDDDNIDTFAHPIHCTNKSCISVAIRVLWINFDSNITGDWKSRNEGTTHVIFEFLIQIQNENQSLIDYYCCYSNCMDFLCLTFIPRSWSISLDQRKIVFKSVNASI